ncbi:MAG: PHP domain-containing protein [Calditrichaeota bacterium]|nr:MAG: PHP domain-containing protein [Calditrichota bacterium]
MENKPSRSDLATPFRNNLQPAEFNKKKFTTEYKSDYLDDFERIDKLDYWQPSKYELEFLPNMKLAGYGGRKNIILQNSADLHVHTAWSDGDDLELVLEAAVAAGLDAVAITDHDEIGGALLARRLVHERQLPIAIVPGIEVSSHDGHIGGLFLTQKVDAGMSAQDTVAAIHALGGFAVANHPFTPRILEKIFNEKWGCRELMQTVPFDAIECYNAVPGSGVRYNLNTIKAMQKLKTKVAITGGSDAHHARFVGMGLTYYPGNDGILSLYNGILNGLTQGAAAYWSLEDKLFYYHHLIKEVVLEIFSRNRR